MKSSGELVKKNRFMSVAAAALVVSVAGGAHVERPAVSTQIKVEAIAPPKAELNLIFSSMLLKMQTSLRDYIAEPPANAFGGVENGPSDIQVGHGYEDITANVNVKSTTPPHNQAFKAYSENPDVNVANPIAQDGSSLNMVLGVYSGGDNYNIDPRYGKNEITHQYSTDPGKDAGEMTGVIDLQSFDSNLDFVGQLARQAGNVLERIEQNKPIAESYPTELRP
jgi:hypothetical protein